jgi:glycosyltransferase involved in cell wall biosynthesis
MDAFVFPTLADGSARVVLEALACGLFVITTPNCGSIVEDGIHGFIVPPGDNDALEKAIREAIATDRDQLYEIGRANSKVVREQYTQKQYGDKLIKLYNELLEKTK